MMQRTRQLTDFVGDAYATFLRNTRNYFESILDVYVKSKMFASFDEMDSFLNDNLPLHFQVPLVTHMHP